MRCGRDRRLGVNAEAADGGGPEPALLLHPEGIPIASEVSPRLRLNDDARPAGSVSSFSPAPRHDEFGVTWFLIDDLSRLSRNTIESLRHWELAEATGVRVVGASDGYDSANPRSSLLLPVLGSMNEAFITQLRSKVKRGMDDAFRRGDNIQPPGVGYRLVDLKDAHGNLVFTHKNTIEKVVEIDPDAADWIRRGAEMFAYEGKSAIDDRQTGKKKVIYLPKSEWI